MKIEDRIMQHQLTADRSANIFMSIFLLLLAALLSLVSAYVFAALAVLYMVVLWLMHFWMSYRMHNGKYGSTPRERSKIERWLKEKGGVVVPGVNID